ncbi:MAG: hypothetical protein EXS00_04510 [Phycisphaerales bacterium]|nr:hypothetical protein [Phycisphaerales bacterium]
MSDSTKPTEPVARPRPDLDRILDGHTRCPGCLYELHGQKIEREPVYGLLIIRCPECGVITSLQDYPIAAPWVRRLGRILAALTLAGLGLCFIMGMIGVGAASELTARHASRPLTRIAQTLAEADGGNRDPSPSLGLQRWNESDLVNRVWSDEEGVRLAWTRWALYMPACLVAAFICGWFWSLILISRKRRAVLLVTISMIALGSLGSWAFFWVERQIFISYLQSGVLRSIVPGASHFVDPFLAATALLQMFMALLSVYLARPLSRLLAFLLLPPQKRVTLAFLWTCDGKNVPRG